MASVPTPQDLANFLQVDVNAVAMQDKLDLALGLMQKATGSRVLQVVNDTITLPGGTRYIWLPERPVTAIGAVTTTVDGVTTARAAGVDYVAEYSHMLKWLGGGRWPDWVNVTYTHGHAADAVPQNVRAVWLSAAGRFYLNPASLSSESRGGHQWAVTSVSGATQGIALTAGELENLGVLPGIA